LAANLKYWLLAIALTGSGCGAFCGQSRAAGAAADTRNAKKVFSAVKAPVGQMAPRAIGRYSLGCVAGALKMQANGPGWQVMRLSRNRFWGHPVLLGYLGKLAADSQRLDGSPGILVGDMAQPIGGPLPGTHASHQNGLDVDLWYQPMPDHTLSAKERERTSARSVVNRKTLTVDKSLWTGTQVKLLHRAASYPKVARIFVHPAVKKALCAAAGTDRAWLQKIRPWYGHSDHFHIRLNCPPGTPSCVAQAAVPAGDDGCGKELDYWFRKLRAKPKQPKKPRPPAKPVLVSSLPPECQKLLAATEQAEKVKAAASDR